MAVVLALIGIVIVVEVVFRGLVIAAFTAAGCDLATSSCTDASGRDLWWSNGFSTWSGLLRAVVVIGPIVVGVFAGAPIFTREFSHGTHIFALTQSVSRRRWWATKVTVCGVPLLAGLVALGVVTEWVDGTTGYTAHHGLDVSNFIVRNVIPAAHGLVAFAIAVAAGVVARSTVAALVAGLIVSGLAVAGLAAIQPHVLPATRHLTSLEAVLQGIAPPVPGQSDPDAAWAGSGYLDANGDEVSDQVWLDCYQQAIDARNKVDGITGHDSNPAPGIGGAVAVRSPGMQPTPGTHAYNETLNDCARSQGIVAQFTDYLPGSRLWPLRWAMAGIAAIVAALFFLIGATRLRPAVAKR